MGLSRIARLVLSIVAVFPVTGHAETRPEELVSRAESMVEEAREQLAISDEECQSNGRQIVVCATQNDTDRYRLPFETVVAGDPDNETVSNERQRLQANPGTCQSWAANRSQCGIVGVSFGVGGSSPGFRTGGLRRVGQ